MWYGYSVTIANGHRQEILKRFQFKIEFLARFIQGRRSQHILIYFNTDKEGCYNNRLILYSNHDGSVLPPSYK